MTESLSGSIISNMGNNLEKLRKRKGWTQQQAADAMGRSKGSYSKLAHSERRLNETSLSQAAKAFGVSKAEILGDAEISTTQANINERELLAGRLSKNTTFRLMVAGNVGVKEIEHLIKKLELDKEFLTDTE